MAHVGNWLEESIQRQERLKELQQKRDAGLLGGTRRLHLATAAQQLVTVATSKDGQGLFFIFSLAGSLFSCLIVCHL